jgi:hypothetical protein
MICYEMILSDVALRYDEHSKDEVRSGRVNVKLPSVCIRYYDNEVYVFSIARFFGFQSNKPQVYTQTKVIFVAFKSYFFTFTVRTCLCYIGD